VSRLGGAAGEFVARGTSPLPLFVLTSAIVAGVWAGTRIPSPRG
jgi:hypothetical protein